MKQPNTNAHWTALSVAKFYETNGTACRARDLYPFVEDIFHKPDQLISALSAVKEILGHITVESSTESGGKTVAFAYYPTEDTIDELQSVGQPSQLPDGRPIADEYDVSIPDDYVRPGDDIEPAQSDAGGLNYVDMVGTGETDGNRKYDASELRREADFSLVDSDETPEMDSIADDADDSKPDDSEDEDMSSDESDFSCCYCGDTFQNRAGQAKHEKHCIDHVHEDALDWLAEQRDEAPVDDRTCQTCGETFETVRARCGHEIVHQDDDADETDDDISPEKTEMTPDTSTEPISNIDPSTALASTPTAGAHADAVDWSRLATRLERKAMRAAENDLYEVAAAYSQFASLAVEGTLDKRIAHIALGTPVLEFEDGAAGTVVR